MELDTPPARFPFLARVVAAAGLSLIAIEVALRLDQQGLLRHGLGGPLLGAAFDRIFARYVPIREWIVANPALAATSAAASLGLLIYAVRRLLILWRNEVIPRLAGTHFHRDRLEFKSRPVDLIAEVSRRPGGHCFVGLTPIRRVLGNRWRPVYLSEEQRSAHRHVIGKTGSGKTQSVLWPQVLQDVLDGKGVVYVSGKGSDEEIATIKGIAAVAGREEELRVLSLPAWNQPSLFTHSYNMVHVEPRSPSFPGGDPVLTAERVFSVLPLGDNSYYNTQAQIFFTNLCKLLHGMVDEHGRGLAFTMRDVAVCLKGIGDNGCWSRALKFCIETSLEQGAALEISSQTARLGRDIHKALSGLVGVVDKFQAPLVNAYDPDIVMSEVLEKNRILYVQLPSNLFKLQAPALGKVLLIDVQQQGSLRQIQRERNQKAFSVVVDEFARFADRSVIDSLNQLRDAHVQFTLAHQSIADLEFVSREFAMAVWDNTRCKDVLKQDNPGLCELIAKSIGTRQRIERTVREEAGPLLTSLATRDASTRLVEAYRLHPNAIKNLARHGQGYVLTDEGLNPVCYGMLPPELRASFPLKRRAQEHARGLRLYEQFIVPAGVLRRPAPLGIERPT
jgi:hypothetical protein